ncbi:hypothetical protein D3C81_953920 [compost metagenome]
MHDRALGVLQVALVARRQRQQLLDLGTCGRNAGVGGAHQFDHVRIALVRHDRAAGGVLRRQRYEGELAGGEQRQIPRDPAQIQRRTTQGFQRGQLELAARQLCVDRVDLHAGETQRRRGVLTIQRQVDAVTGGGAQRIGIDQRTRVTRTDGIVDERFCPAGPPHARRRHHGTLDMGVTRQRLQLFGLRTIQRDLGDVGADLCHTLQLLLQPQTRGHQDLVIAAATSVDLATRITQTLGQARFNGRMAILVLFVQHEGATAEVIRQRRQFALERGQFVRRQDADVLQAFGMRGTGLDVVQEEFTVEDDVIAGQEGLDLRVNRDAGFLPEQVGHGEKPLNSRIP